MRAMLVLSGACLAAAAIAGPPAFVPPGAAIRLMVEADAERDPAKLAARIGANARAAGDRLAARDTGADTRQAQARILRDLDRLLDQPDLPPPEGGAGEPPPGDPPPEGGEPPPGGKPKPKGKPKSGSPPRKGGDGQGQPDAQQGAQQGSPPGPAGEQAPQPGEPKPGEQKPGGPGGPGQPGKAATRAGPLAEDAVAKQVWGHLPEQLRREMNQYYKEQFMPKYSEMLRDYYTGLADAARPAARGRVQSP